MSLFLLSGAMSLFALEPDEKHFVYNMYGGPNAVELKIVPYIRLPNDTWEVLGWEAEFDLIASLQLYPGYWQHTYSKTLSPFETGKTYRADFSKKEVNGPVYDSVQWVQGM